MVEHHLPGHLAVAGLDHVVGALEIEEARVDPIVPHQRVARQLGLEIDRLLRLARLDAPAVLDASLDEDGDQRRALDPGAARGDRVDPGAVRRGLGEEIDAGEAGAREVQPFHHDQEELRVRHPLAQLAGLLLVQVLGQILPHRRVRAARVHPAEEHREVAHVDIELLLEVEQQLGAAGVALVEDGPGPVILAVHDRQQVVA